MTKIPSPEKIGLPEKFTKWRSGQEEMIDVMITSKKRAVALCAPTGSGKSPAYVAAAILSGLPTCIVTQSKGLQDQLMDDFHSIGMVDLRGRRNYQCQMREDYTCETGYDMRCTFKGTISCPSSKAEMKAATSSLVVTNYDKWTSSKKYGTGMSHFSQVIFDEGHEAPGALARAMQVVLGIREITEDLKMDFPPQYDIQNMIAWKTWASIARAKAEKEMVEVYALIGGTSSPKPSWIRKYAHFRNLCRRLATVALANAREWIVDESPIGYQFDPIRPARYSESTLLLRVPRIVVVSATQRIKTMFMIGMGMKDFDFKEFKSTFDPKRCPIYYIPTMRVDKNAHDLSMLWVKVDQIWSRRRDRKGIIHTISYARRDQIKTASRYSSDMIINQKGEPTNEIIEQFKKAGPGTVLVSPSVGTGYDFPGKDCEWQFVCKIPFPDSRAKIIQARQHDDPEYGPYYAMQTLVQAFGRGNRSEDDHCENFIGDEHLDWFLPRWGHLAPNHFRGTFKRVDVVPPPLPRLV